MLFLLLSMYDVSPSDLERFPVVTQEMVSAAHERKVWVQQQVYICTENRVFWNAYGMYCDNAYQVYWNLHYIQDGGSYDNLKIVRMRIGAKNYALGQIPWIWD